MAENIEFFGVDLGNTKIKLANIKKDGSQLKIEGLASINSSTELLTNESEEGIKNIAKSISDAYKQLKIGTKNCVVSLPEQSIFSRLVVLPEVEESKVAEAIHWALKPLIPTPLEQVNISFVEIDRKTVGGKNYFNWYAVAAPKILVEKTQKIFQGSGLNLLAIETETLAICRMAWYNYAPNEDMMILDIGGESSDLILCRKGVTLFSQTISTGSQSIDKILAADFGIDIEQAKQIKLKYSSQSEENKLKIQRSIEPILQILSSELSRTMVYYREKLGEKNLTKVYITGGGSGLGALSTYINQKLGVEVVSINPANKLNLSGNAEKVLQEVNISGFNVAIGLALKGYM